MRLNRKWRKIAFFVLPGIILVIALATYFGVNNARGNASIQTSVVDPGSPPVDSDNLKIFPELLQEDFYDFLTIKNGKAQISDDFIAAVINAVVSKVKISDGAIEWDYSFKDDQVRDQLTMTFSWVPSDKATNNVQSKTYRFDVSTL